MASNGKRPLKGKREISNTVGKVGDKGTKDSFSTYKESQLLYKHMNNMVNDEQHLELLDDEYVTLNGISIDLIRRELTKLLVEQIRAISIHDNLFSVDEHLDENHVLHTDFQAIEDIQYNGETGDWTITSIDNSVKIINTPVENFLASATFDPDTHILTLTLTDGFTFSVDLTELMDMYDVIPDRGLEIIERNFGIKDSSVLREMLSLELATDIAKIPGMVEDIDLLEEKTQTLIDEQISSVKIYSQVFNSIVDNILDLSFEAIRSISYNQSTGAFTVTSLDDSVEVIPTDIVTDFTFDEETYKLRIDLTNEKSFEVDLTYLIDAYGVIPNSGLELIDGYFGIKKRGITKAMLADEVLQDLPSNAVTSIDVSTIRVVKEYPNILREGILYHRESEDGQDIIDTKIGRDRGYILSYNLFGKSVQDGMPTPDNPVEINSVGKLEGKLLIQSAEIITEIPLTEPLRSLPNGVRDDLSYKKVGKIVLDDNATWTIDSAATIFDGTIVFLSSVLPNVLLGAIDSGQLKLLCNRFPMSQSLAENPYSVNKTIGIVNWGGRFRVRVSTALATTLAEWKTWLSLNTVELFYILATPTPQNITKPPIPWFGETPVLINEIQGETEFIID